MTGLNTWPWAIIGILLVTTSRSALGATQPSIEWETGGSFPGGKAAVA